MATKRLRVTIYGDASRAGLLNVNEVRAAEGLPSIAFGSIQAKADAAADAVTKFYAAQQRPPADHWFRGWCWRFHLMTGWRR